MGSRTGSSPHRDPSPRLAACLSFPGSSLGAVGRLPDPFRNIPGTAADGRPCPFPRRAGMGAPRHPPSGRPPWVGVWRGPPQPVPGPGGRCRPGQGRPRALSPAGAAPAAVGPSGTSSTTGWWRVGPLPRAGSGAIPAARCCGNRLGGGACPVPPPPALASLALGMGAMCRGPGRAAGWIVPQFPLALPCCGAQGSQGVGALCLPPPPPQHLYSLVGVLFV